MQPHHFSKRFRLTSFTFYSVSTFDHASSPSPGSESNWGSQVQDVPHIFQFVAARRVGIKAAIVLLPKRTKKATPPMSSPLESAVSNLSFMLEQNARLITTVGTLSAISIAVVPILEQNYRAYIDAGRGGLPPNLYGWAKSSLLKIFLSCETTNTDMYLTDPNKDTWLDSSEVTKRFGERPTFNWHPVPSRQITQRADAAMNQVCPLLPCYIKFRS